MNRLLIARILRLVFVILILLLIARLVLLGLGTDPAFPVAAAILTVSDPLTLPFRLFFPPLPPLGFVGIDYAALAALFAALLLVWLTFRLLRLESES
jgi:uncharacterized protein YggT (Ycf19 family)